jgi:hypothetical protein
VFVFTSRCDNDIFFQLPGVIMYAECKSRLEAIRTQRPELFDSPSLYRAAQRMLESFTFKLTARRDVNNLFSVQAKMRQKN